MHRSQFAMRLRAIDRARIAMMAAVRVMPAFSAYSSSFAMSGGGNRSETTTPRSSSGSLGLPPGMERARRNRVGDPGNAPLAQHGALVGFLAPAMTFEPLSASGAFAFGSFENRHGARVGLFVHHGSYRNTLTPGCQAWGKGA
jgi:hypothetical protein